MSFLVASTILLLPYFPLVYSSRFGNSLTIVWEKKLLKKFISISLSEMYCRFHCCIVIFNFQTLDSSSKTSNILKTLFGIDQIFVICSWYILSNFFEVLSVFNSLCILNIPDFHVLLFLIFGSFSFESFEKIYSWKFIITSRLITIIFR